MTYQLFDLLNRQCFLQQIYVVGMYSNSSVMWKDVSLR